MSEELDAFLQRHVHIDAVQLFISDPGGVLRGKTIRRHELESLYSTGRHVAGSILGLDITGADVEATGLVWETGDADKLCHPVPGTLQPVPWLERTGQVMLSMYDLDGATAAADPRHVLARTEQVLNAAGYAVVFACELEFYLLREQSDGSWLPAGSQAVHPGQGERIEAYSLGRLDSLAPLFREVLDAAQAQSLGAGTVMSEYAPGQFEITLQHRKGALAAVDEAVQLKRLLKGVAAKHGCLASFMAKPFTARSGSGAHLHLSLADAAGHNMFSSEDPAGTPLLREAIAGLATTAADAFLAFAPHGNSYRRFQRQSYAPVAVNWGINNRSVSLRVPAGPAASRHVEHRFCGADANLYLAAAAVLGGVLHGISARLDPGPATEGNGYSSAATTRWPSLPADWHTAMARARDSSFLRETFGSPFMRAWLAIKAQEQLRWDAEVTPTDLLWYLRDT
ncbi:MAG: glutamine synthetase family protein [Steroidobacteraceae bacterium]